MPQTDHHQPPANDALPLWQDARPVVGEPGVRDLYGPYAFNLDAMLEGRAFRLLDAAPAAAGLTDAQLRMAESAFFRIHIVPGKRHRAHRRFIETVRAEQARREADLARAA